MKYSVHFVTYNTIEVEADSQEEAERIAQERFLNECDPMWDEYDVEEVR